MKIDLCKLFGVEEGEEFRLSNSSFKNRIVKNTLQHYVDDDEGNWDWIEHLMFNSVINSEVTRLPKKKQFSQDTLNFFKLVDKKWEWIAKDKCGSVCLYDEKPIKNKYNRWNNNRDGWTLVSEINQSLFDQILWSDEEPIYIPGYVER